MRERTLTVVQLNEYVKGVFEDELVLHDLYVEGEVFECKQTASALFVTLKERDSLLHCVCFGKAEALTVGDMVSLYGNVTFYERSGRISFVFSSARKIGEGDLLAAFNARKDKLEKEGVFAHKKELPPFIRSLAVITSETGAVIHDFIQTVHRKHKFTDVYVYASSVQGKSAAADIIGRLRVADAKGYDLIVLARGGGSGDDLSVFNEESLVRAVAACVTPTVSAVGHETDFTLCDFAASVRAGTPSMAGEIVSRRNEAFSDRLYAGIRSLSDGVNGVFSRKTERLYRSAAALSYKSAVKLERIRSHVAALSAACVERVQAVWKQKFGAVHALSQTVTTHAQNVASSRAEQVQKLAARLENNNPLRILSLGYAKLYANGKAAAFEDVHVGDEVKAVLADGTLTAIVKEKKVKGE